MPPPDTGPPVVFLGPTLAVQEATRILPATYLRPAAQGSVVLAVQNYRPSAILLVDGVFECVPAVRHKELLWALSRGIPVFGAGSMGALRAAELHDHGMIGVGLIFRWFRRWPLLADDAVALLHGPPELGSSPLTRALVDVRLTLRRAERSGLVDRGTRDRLERTAAALNFRDRTLARIVEDAFDEMPAARRMELRAGLRGAYVSQKKEDALSALRLLKELVSSGALRGRPAPFVFTTAFLRDMRYAGIDPS